MKTFPSKFTSFLGVIIFVSLLLSCAGQQKIQQESLQKKQLNKWMQDSTFQIEHRWMNPLRGQQISLIGNPNFIKIYGDQVEVFLPYFGVRQFGGDYGTASGIEFEGVPENLEIIKNNEEEYTINFKTSAKTEHYQFKITIYPNHNVHTHVTTSQRDNISYDGTISGTDEKEE
ncbi:DUF4251 domain-containing protein [Mesonia aestuariivivens]|uniref:DUF4251 domain-containing protein n=1 Tax=Mesonia aestuariivivens TaxID=2796128 RepID=A0ABS6VYV6_9FLAO|nr:DUF4251 domain-containing protein [Mesonia aestuariivivens]MBW2960765.1 DUF4251 domain-containing protein [Mesonia aestuariivivens]